MPLSVSKMAADIATVSFAYSGETVNVVYYPSRVTEKTFAQALSLMDMEKVEDVVAGFASINDMLCTLIKSWDVLEDDNVTMYALSPDRLAVLPIRFRVQVLFAISSDIRPEALTPQAN